MAINTKLKVKRTVYNIFTKKYGLHVQADATKYLEDLLINNANVVDAIEKIIKAYKKRYSDERIVIVDEPTVREVITAMQSSAAIAATLTPFQRVDEEINDSLQEMKIDETPQDEQVDVSMHFHVVDAFDMPKLVYDEHTRTFHMSKDKPCLLSNAKEKGSMYRERFAIVKQRILRNENFCPSTMSMSDDSSFIKITPIKTLIGRDSEEELVLFGMLTQMEDNKVYLEDEDAHIELIIDNNTIFNEGLFTDGTFVLVDGIYTGDGGFHVLEFNLPPPETREMSDVLFSHVNFMGLPKPLVDEKLLKIEETTNEDIAMVFLSDVFLDQPKVMNALREVFKGYSESQVPLAFILMGNFSSKPFNYSSVESAEYKDNFTTLAEMIGEFHNLATHSNFVFVPGTRDPWGGNTLPQKSLPANFVSRMRQKAKKVKFASNPCRIRYCTQDIVIFREDLLTKLRRNTLLKAKTEEEEERGETDLRKHLIRTVIDEGHLCPLPLSVKPIYWSYDSALRLYPLPHTLVLSDKCENYGITYEGTHCINPGSFPTSDFSWSVYYPSTRLSQRCSLDT